MTELRDLIESDLEIFCRLLQKKGEALIPLPDGSYSRLEDGASGMNYYLDDKGSNLYPLGMSDQDEIICGTARRILVDLYGRTDSMKIMDLAMEKIENAYRDYQIINDDEKDFFICYVGSQAFAIPTHVYVRKQKFEVGYENKIEEFAIITDMKYRAFCAGYAPIGIRSSNGLDSMVLWRPLGDK